MLLCFPLELSYFLWVAVHQFYVSTCCWSWTCVDESL